MTKLSRRHKGQNYREGHACFDSMTRIYVYLFLIVVVGTDRVSCILALYRRCYNLYQHIHGIDVYEPVREKTNNLGSDKDRHKLEAGG